MTTTKRKTKTAPKVAPAKVTPLKSRPLNDQLRSDILHLAMRNLFVAQIKAASNVYYTRWWALFRSANEQQLNFWCCLPGGWQSHGHYQSRNHNLRVYTGTSTEWGFSARLDMLREHVKLPANFHAFPHCEETYLCTAEVKATMHKVHPHRTYRVVAEKTLAKLREAQQQVGKYETERNTTASQLLKLLKETRTTKTLLEVWPEGERFIPHEPVPTKQALSVDVAALTAALKAGGAM